MPPLFCDVSDTTFWGSVGTMLVVVIGAVAAAYVKVYGKRSDTGEKARAYTIGEYQKLLKTYEHRMTRLERKIEDNDSAVNQLRRDHSDEMNRHRIDYQNCLLREERMRSRMESYEAALEQAHIPFKKSPVTESDEHSALGG